MLTVIRGAGDLASGIALRLRRAGIRVVMTDVERPTAIRRTVCFSQAVVLGETVVEGVTARRASSPKDALALLEEGVIPVLADPEGACIPALRPAAVVDAILAKRNLGTKITDAPVVIGVGPGFTAGEDCHAVVETMRGHYLGRVMYQGSAIPNTGIPGLIGGFAGERVLRAPADGVFRQVLDIGAQVKMGDVAATVDGQPMVCTLDGVLRGILADGTPVHKGMKAGDIDPRCEIRHCYCASDKALAVGGGVLEAILHFTGALEEASAPAAADLYSAVQNELTEGRSLAALAMLIDGGRELEFTFRSGTYFLSRHGSARGVSLWHEKEEQAFSNVWSLLSGARLEGVPFQEAWISCAIVTLF
nr:selenium-dependent molybdenum cofactor biosynthesis protein YqeB [uncultured Oscillibacter sp.]